MNPPPPMPENSGSTTLSANRTAAAASMALPPLRRILAPASAASGCDTATTPPRKPGPGGTARPEASCDAQAGAKPSTVKLSTSSDLRMSAPRSQPAIARIAACAAGIGIRLLDLRQIVVRVLRKRAVGRCPARRELEDPLELRRDAALIVPGHRGIALVFTVAVVVIVLAAAVAITVAIIVVVMVAPRPDRPDRQVVEARRVEAEDLALHPRGELGITVAPAHGLRDPEPPQRLDLPLRRAVPHRVRAEHDAVVVLARVLVDLRVRGVGDPRVVKRPAHHVAVRVVVDLGGGGDVVALPGVRLQALDLLLDEPQVAGAGVELPVSEHARGAGELVHPVARRRRLLGGQDLVRLRLLHVVRRPGAAGPRDGGREGVGDDRDGVLALEVHVLHVLR